jgi:membrane-associated phospholipid phosphatase
LGVHFPSDVLGALVLGTGWVLLWLSAAKHRPAELVPVVG